jgi:hypothetical protein
MLKTKHTGETESEPGRVRISNSITLPMPGSPSCKNNANCV